MTNIEQHYDCTEDLTALINLACTLSKGKWEIPECHATIDTDDQCSNLRGSIKQDNQNKFNIELVIDNSSIPVFPFSTEANLLSGSLIPHDLYSTVKLVPIHVRYLVSKSFIQTP